MVGMFDFQIQQNVELIKDLLASLGEPASLVRLILDRRMGVCSNHAGRSKLCGKHSGRRGVHVDLRRDNWRKATGSHVRGPFLCDGAGHDAGAAGSGQPRGQGAKEQQDHFIVVRRSRSREVLSTNLSTNPGPFPTDYAYTLIVADGGGERRSVSLPASWPSRPPWNWWARQRPGS